MTKIKPLAGQVIVEERKFAENIKPGQIVVPEASREQLTENIVHAIGKDVTLDIKVGDRVFISKYGGTPMVVDGVNYRAVKATEAENDIMAVYTGE